MRLVTSEVLESDTSGLFDVRVQAAEFWIY